MRKTEVLTPNQWRELRDLRLAALLDSPEMFLSTYDHESGFSHDQWRAEFERGEWHACHASGRLIGLLGITREPDTPTDLRYLEYLWVSPTYRRSGIAHHMLSFALDTLRATGIRTVLLWVLDGNDSAVRLYQKLGFVKTDYSQRLAERPGRIEEQMMLTLA